MLPLCCGTAASVALTLGAWSEGAASEAALPLWQFRGGAQLNTLAGPCTAATKLRIWRPHRQLEWHTQTASHTRPHPCTLPSFPLHQRQQPPAERRLPSLNSVPSPPCPAAALSCRCPASVPSLTRFIPCYTQQPRLLLSAHCPTLQCCQSMFRTAMPRDVIPDKDKAGRSGHSAVAS